jgi:hypothetical protein
MKTSVLLTLLLIFFSVVTSASAHSGRTDSSGCHNCYTSYCAGEYHCHGGGGSSGGSSGYSAPQSLYSLSAPVNPTNANINQKISAKNTCNYDVSINWDDSNYSDRYSIAISKSAGTDPGLYPDTNTNSHTFTNIAPGKWFINLKAGNRERWTNIISYWDVTLPVVTPRLSASISGNLISYDLACLKKVDGPPEFLAYLKTNDNSPSGSFTINNTEGAKIILSGTDFKGKVYSQTLEYIPKSTPDSTNAPIAPSVTEDESDTDGNWVYGLITVGVISYFIGKSRSKNKPSGV